MMNSERTNSRTFFRMRGRGVEVFGRTFALPASRMARIAIGIALLVGGVFWILPFLGLWMLPLGLMVLSIDIALVRRARRRCDVRWSRWRASRRTIDVDVKASKAPAAAPRDIGLADRQPPR